MRDPTRWSELYGPEVSAALNAEKSDVLPTESLTRLEHAMGISGAAATTTATVKAATLLSSVQAKAIALVMTGVGLTVTGYVVTKRISKQAPPSASVADPMSVNQRGNLEREKANGREAVIPPPTALNAHGRGYQPQPIPAVSTATRKTPVARHSVVKVRNPDSTPEGSKEKREILAESALLVRAKRTLENNPLSTLKLCDQHRTHYPQGFLVQERAVLEVEAYLKLGRKDKAKILATRFLNRWPDSLYASKIQALVSYEQN